MTQDNRTAAQEMGGFALNAMVHGRETAAWVWGLGAAHFAAKVRAERSFDPEQVGHRHDDLPHLHPLRLHVYGGPK